MPALNFAVSDSTGTGIVPGSFVPITGPRSFAGGPGGDPSSGTRSLPTGSTALLPPPIDKPLGTYMGPTTWGWGGDIGGTSGESNDNPTTNLLNLNIGGFNASYDIGPNTDYFAKGAYNYLDNAFREDSNLLGGTILGSQNFLSSFAVPLANFNTEVLPSMFQTLNAQNFDLGRAAVAAEQTTAQASIAASNAAAAQAGGGGGGFCFITTAVCEVMGEPDNGPTLTTLRAFRDRYMLSREEGRKKVAHYYQIAPEMVQALKRRPHADRFFARLFHDYIMPAIEAIERGCDAEAESIYTAMVSRVVRVATGVNHG